MYMKKIILSIVCLFFLNLIYSQKNFLDFESTHINFGLINVGDTAQKQLKITNTCSDTLELIIYRENIDDLKILINEYVIKPNEYIKIDLVFIPKTIGSVYEKIEFIFTDKKEPFRRILFSGLVK